MTDLDPNAFRGHLNDVIARFTATSAPVNEVRAAHLAAELRRTIGNLPFVKGPFVEMLPDFEKGASLEALHASGRLHTAWAAFGANAPGVWRRPLHAHQDDALGRTDNFLVATGTGSGKTESFLYPLVEDILAAGDLHRPGVRAILVYPLNALANDQMNRIASLLFRDLGDPGITLGRYTGQVKARATRAEEATRLRSSPSFVDIFGEDAGVPDHWLLARDEMRAKPPHILITNYAMLEHILLLPTNRPLLATADLRWIVLDEIHTYAGAQAIEVSFLLRRLKAHLGMPDGQVRCVGTSASLDPARKAELADFAARLFGEPFAGAGSVITSRRKLHPRLVAARPSGLAPDRWAEAGELAKVAREIMSSSHAMSVEDWNLEARLLALPELALDPGPSLGDALIDRLAGFEEVHAIARPFEGGAMPLGALADHVFPGVGAAAVPALVGLVAIGVIATSPDARVFPLLPARYHLISRVPDRIGVALAVDKPDGVEAVVIGTEHGRDDRPAFELFVCRNCGEPYLEAFLGPEGFEPAAGSGPRHVLRLVPGAVAAEEEEEEEEIDVPQLVHIDPANGRVLEPDDPGALALEDIPLAHDEDDGNDYLRRCAACNHRSSCYSEPIATVRPGD